MASSSFNQAKARVNQERLKKALGARYAPVEEVVTGVPFGRFGAHLSRAGIHPTTSDVVITEPLDYVNIGRACATLYAPTNVLLRGSVLAVQGEVPDEAAPPVVEPPIVPSPPIVIAAHDSYYVRGDVDYVCDGVADQIEFQAAIDLCHEYSGGGEIRLLAGHFYMSDGISLGSNINFFGDAHGSVIKRVSATGRHFTMFSVGNSQVHDLVIDYDASPGLSEDCIVEATGDRQLHLNNLNCLRAYGTAIRVFSSAKSAITNCNIDVAWVGIEVVGSSKMYVHRNDVSGCHSAGIFLYDVLDSDIDGNSVVSGGGPGIVAYVSPPIVVP